MEDGGKALAFHCPGCNHYHAFQVERGSTNPDGPIWDWNQDMEKPTFHPSLMVNRGAANQCHFVVKEGKISYLNDSYHELAGRVVNMQEEPD